MSETLNNAMNVLKEFLTLVESKVAIAHAKGLSLPATALAKDKEIVDRFGFEWPQAYQIINAYVSSNKTTLELRKGPKGGITKKVIATSTPTNVVDAVPTNVVDAVASSMETETTTEGLDSEAVSG